MNYFKKYKNIIVVIFVVICIIGIYYIYDNKKTNEQIQRNINEINNRENSDKTKVELNKVVNDYKEESKNDNEKLDKELNDLDKYRLVILNTEETNYSGGYHDIEVTIQNVASEDINYVKIGLNFKNEKGEIVQSDWINDSSVIKPNAKQTLTKKVSDKIKYTTVEPEIQEVKVK